MRTIRLRMTLFLAKALGIPIKVKDEFWGAPYGSLQVFGEPIVAVPFIVETEPRGLML